MVDTIGSAVAARALEERRHVVTEVFGLDQPATVELIEADEGGRLPDRTRGCAGQRGAIRRLEQERGLDNVSSYFTDEFNVRWLRDAARDYVESKKLG